MPDIESAEKIDNTIFVTTIGDTANFSDCMEHLKLQTVQRSIEVIDHVAPIFAAFQQMLDRCTSTFYVQVDEDMILFPHAIETLEQRMQEAPPEVAMACFPLWDCDTGRPIYGLKIYRHQIVKQFPYRDTASIETDQLARIRAAGFSLDLLPIEESLCLGEHGRHYTPRTIFKRWQRMFEKHVRVADSRWIEEWPARLLDRYMQTREPLHLYAFLGAVAGIAREPRATRENDWTETNEALLRMEKFFPLAMEAAPAAPSAPDKQEK